MTDCVDQLETLHQFTGQCWSDASLIFLWFAAGIGNKVQEYLEKDSFLEEFEDFYLHSSFLLNEIKSTFPVLNNPEIYDQFYEALIEYSKELKNRYMNWKYPTTSVLLRRTESCILSKQLENYGIYLSEILSQKPASEYKVKPENIQHLSQAIKSLNKTKYISRENLENELERNLNQQSFGYDTNKFGKVIYILLQFFFKRNFVDFSTMLQNTVNIDYFKNIHESPRENGILFLTRLSFLSFIQYVIPLYKKYAISCVLGTDVPGDEEGGHVISLLTCNNLSTILYNDNDGFLQVTNWPIIFDALHQLFNLYYGKNSDWISIDAKMYILEFKNKINNVTFPEFRGLEEFKPIFCFVDFTKKNYIFFKKTGEVMKIEYSKSKEDFESNLNSICNSVDEITEISYFYLEPLQNLQNNTPNNRQEGGRRKKGKRKTRKIKSSRKK